MAPLLLEVLNMWPFKKKEIKKLEPKQYEVGKAYVTITGIGPIDDDDVIIERLFTGYTYFSFDFDGYDMVKIISANQSFNKWLEHGKYGTLSIGDGRYIPLSRIDHIDVVFEKHQVEI